MENAEETKVELWNDMENMEERKVEMWNDMENMEERHKSNSEKIWKIQKKIVKRYERYGKYGRKVFSFYKPINTACNLFKFTLCPTVRGNNSVSEGISL